MIKRGFTDKLYVINLIIVILVTIASFIVVIYSGQLAITDMSPIVSVLSGAYGELAVYTGFIVWKAKNENINKHRDDLDSDFEEVDLDVNIS